MSPEPHAQQERAVGFLSAQAPAGSVALRVARFRRHTLRSAGGELLDQLMADDGSPGRDAPAGLHLSWVDGTGQAMAEHVAHPAPPELESALLPLALLAAQRVNARVELVARHEALLATPRVVDALSTLPRDALGAAGYREAPPRPTETLDVLERGGFVLESADPRGFRLTRTRQRRKQPTWLLMLLPIVFFAPVLMLLSRSVAGVVHMIRQVLRKALHNQREQLAWGVRDGTLTVVAEAQPGERHSQSVLLSEVLATSFAPAGVQVTDQDAGWLRAITAQAGVTLEHAFAAPDTDQGSNEARAERARATGQALRRVLEWLACAHRAS